MSLNKVAKGSNMYQNWVTHTWNPLGGECSHGCEYCQVQKTKHRFPKLEAKYTGETRLVERYLNDNFGKDKFIFVCDMQDLFSYTTPFHEIMDILHHCLKFDFKNKYLFQTKNPYRFINFLDVDSLPSNSVFCTTIETNRSYHEMGNTPPTNERAEATLVISKQIPVFVTVEPIMDFDLQPMVELIKTCQPQAVFIGADSKNCNLPEPPAEKILELIVELSKFTEVRQKANLGRLLK